MTFSIFPPAWTAFASFLALMNTMIPSARAQSTSSSDTVTFQGSDGTTETLLTGRTPALFTGNFGDCMGGQSLLNLTAFDAAYYQDNMTVVFNLAGDTSLQDESLMLYFEVYAYGENRYDLTWNPCNANFATLCPLNASVPVSGGAVIPVTPSDIASIPPIALAIPDFEGKATLRIFSNATQTQIGCFQAVMQNGASFYHPAAVGSALGVMTLVAVIASFATTIYGLSVPQIRTHYAHSLSVLVVFETLQYIFFSGALSLDWPSVLPAFWSNFAWSAGQIYTSSMINSVNSFVGVSGNSSQVGGAGSSVLNNNGGLQQQIYGRSVNSYPRSDIRYADYNSPELIQRGEELASKIYKRSVNSTSGSKLYSWAGTPVAPGLPLPGNWSGFAGELQDVGVPVADAFLVGFLWFLILFIILLGATIVFKLSLELLSKIKWIKEDRLKLFRDNWLSYLGLVALRAMLIGFFMMMTLTLFQFSNGGKAGPIAIAVIVFLIFFVSAFGVAFYACYFRAKTTKLQSEDGSQVQRKKALGFLPWYRTVRNEEAQPSTDENKTKSSFLKIDFILNENEKQSVHDDEVYTKRFGWLSARFRRTRWWFFAAWVIYQFVRAAFIGGARGSPTAQVIGLFVWEVIAFALIVWINPFEGARNTALAVYMLGISKVLTAGLSIAFLPQLNVARIPTTVIGVVIIVIQGFLTIGLLILIVLGAISTYMSLYRNREDFHPRNLEGIRNKYIANIEMKATDLPPPPPPEPEEPKEPYFSVNSVKRAPKIEDEDVDHVPDMQPQAPPHPGAQVQSSLANRSRANSMASRHSNYGGAPYGARVARASWSSRDFQDFQESQDAHYRPPSRAPSHTANNSVSTSGQPLIRPQASQSSMRVSTPVTDPNRQYQVPAHIRRASVASVPE